MITLKMMSPQFQIKVDNNQIVSTVQMIDGRKEQKQDRCIHDYG